ncbi:hypothetical protein [Rhizobium leguminosarum]|uniref:hypothetical protein n=1 Tax=Rhizobium leguminosarum TaxID=384 RepID=UPI003F9E2B7D
MEAQDGDLSNEAAAHADILKWSNDIPAWQRDAQRRLSGQARLEEVDLSSLVAICKAVEQGIPLDATHLWDLAAMPSRSTHLPRRTPILWKGRADRHLWRRWRWQIRLCPHPEAALPDAFAQGLRAILPNICAAASDTPSANVEFYIGGQKRHAS